MLQNKLFLSLLLLLTACIPAQGDRDIPAELDCQTVVRQPQTRSPDAIEITVAANAYRDFCWKLYGVMMAADQMEEETITVVPMLHNMVGPAFQELLAEAFRTGNAPDIIGLTDALGQPFAQAGYLYPLDNCIAQHPEFGYIRPSAWGQVTWNNQIWGIPFEVGTFLLYFNKQKLAELGWLEDEIADLPQKIEAGEFTLTDLVDVAQQAVQLGVVQPGFGFWPHLDDPWTLQLTYVVHGGRIFDEVENKLVITQSALQQAYRFHQKMFESGITHPQLADPNHVFLDLTMGEDAVAHGRVLFWVGGNYNWSMLTMEYQDDLILAREPTPQPEQPIGYALFPAAHAGQTGKALWVQTGFYAISAPKFSQRLQQSRACALLAKTLRPEIAIRHSARIGFLSTLTQEAISPYLQPYPFIAAQYQMLPVLVALPRHLQPDHDLYTTTVNNFLRQVQRGELAPAVAADLAIVELRRQLRAALIVE